MEWQAGREVFEWVDHGAICTNINKCSFGLLSFLVGVLCLVVEELHGLRVVVQTLEKIRKQSLVVRQHLHILVIEVHPDLHSVKGLQGFRRNKPEPVYMVAMVEVFSNQEEHQVSIYLILVLLSLVDGKDEPTSVLVMGILPLWLNACLEVLERVDTSEFVLDIVPK